jgi:hypothetical protein
MTRAAITVLLGVCATMHGQTGPGTRPDGEAVIAPARRDVPGKRTRLQTGELFVPDFFRPSDKVDVVVWFLGAAWCAQQVFSDAGKNAVLLCTDRRTLDAGFAEPRRFQDLLNEVSKQMNAPIGKVCLSSFSGGYTAVRDILRHEQFRNSISDVVLLDSLYAPRVPGKSDQLVDEAMQPFLDFARRATSGQCIFIYTHLYPPLAEHRSNTTTLTANYLIDRLKVNRTIEPEGNARPTPLLYRAEKMGFHVLGYAGMTNQDHFDHFYNAADVLRMTSLPAKEQN